MAIQQGFHRLSQESLLAREHDRAFSLDHANTADLDFANTAELPHAGTVPVFASSSSSSLTVAQSFASVVA
jgi:hypothetical protein